MSSSRMGRLWQEEGATDLGSQAGWKTFSVTEYGKSVYGKEFLSINFADAEGDIFETLEGDLSAKRVLERLSAICLELDFVPRRP